MTHVTGGPAPSPADVEAADRIRHLSATELDRVRDRATRWRDGLGALAALFGVALVVKGRDAVSNLVPWAGICVGAALLAAMVAILFSAVQAMIAAFGWEGRPESVGPAAGLHERLLQNDRRRVRDAVRRLRISAICLIAGLSVMIGAAGLGMFAPQVAAPGPTACLRISAASGAVTTTVITAPQTVKVTGTASVAIGPCR